MKDHLKVEPHAPAIQADFRASGDRLLDPDQQQKRLDLIRNCVNSILQLPHRKMFEEILRQYQEKYGGGLTHSGVVHTDITELVVIVEKT